MGKRWLLEAIISQRYSQKAAALGRREHRASHAALSFTEDDGGRRAVSGEIDFKVSRAGQGDGPNPLFCEREERRTDAHVARSWSQPVVRQASPHTTLQGGSTPKALTSRVRSPTGQKKMLLAAQHCLCWQCAL